jgi:hypothetical protein
MIDFMLTTLGLDKVVVVHASYPFHQSSQPFLRFTARVSERSQE